VGVLGKISGLFRPKQKKMPVASNPRYVNTYRRKIAAHYDSARTTDENERHWANADALSPNALMTPAIRNRVRMRARYEAQQNNSYAKGMILTLANDLIGKGPRLQLNNLSQSESVRLQKMFVDWATEVDLAQKLRTMRIAKCVDGESFAVMITNPSLKSPVKLDIRPIEADRVEEPFQYLRREEDGVDAVRTDTNGNITHYYLQDTHPGGVVSDGAWRGEWVSADHILHVFRRDRPEQLRGISEIVTALPLFAMSRRFTLATLAAAETAADFAAVLYTDSPAVDSANLGQDEWFDAIPIEYRAMVTLPNSWKMEQFRAEHPSASYDMFKREILNEIARCLNMPFNVAAANSSSYNYSSGRLDHQTYFKSIDVERDEWECAVLDKILYAWLTEAYAARLIDAASSDEFSEWSWQWHWDNREDIDEAKSANAKDTKLRSGMTNRVLVLQRDNIDLDQHDADAARSYGKTVEQYRDALFQQQFSVGATDGKSGTTEPPQDRESGEGPDDSSVEATHFIPHWERRQLPTPSGG
jgi:capsid protein